MLRMQHGKVRIAHVPAGAHTGGIQKYRNMQMAALLCVTYPEDEPLPRIEEEISTFAEELKRTCDSVTRCEIAIHKSPTSRGATWSVRATLNVFGDSISIVRFQRDLSRGDALKVALCDILTQASQELSAIGREHAGCGCIKENDPAAYKDTPAPAGC